MLNSLPPGIVESMLPGNRPEDKEIEVVMIFTQGEIDDLRNFHENQYGLELSVQHELAYIVANIIEQFDKDDL